ncbi:MAG: DUF4394 domain-containing protein [Actinomycetota bacterium]
MHIARRTFALALVATLTMAAITASARGDERSKRRMSSHSQRQLRVLALTDDQRLIRFKEDHPELAQTIGTVGGLIGDSSLVGIDVRPLTSTLYGVGNAGGIYTLDTETAAATKVSQLSVALTGSSFGVDFNPAADRLRIVSDTGQNLRHDVNTPAGPTAVDTSLTYPPGAATGIAGAAYTNNDADPTTATTLFDLDSILDQVAVQSPANSGQLAPTGKLGHEVTSVIGFDIYSTIENGTTVALRAFASLEPAGGGAVTLYRVRLLIGTADEIRTFRSSDRVIDIAIPVGQT